MDSPAVSPNGFVAARGGSCRRYDLAMQGIPDNIPHTLPWPRAHRGDSPIATPIWVHNGEWLAYNTFRGIAFMDPKPHHEPREPIAAASFIDHLESSPDGRYLELHMIPGNVEPGTDTCRGGTAY
jgi:hypothetical protein